MKFILSILAVSLVASHAAVAPPVDYEVRVNDIVHEIEQIAINTAQALEHQFEEIVIDPLHQVEDAVQAIEDRKEEDEDCVVAQEPAILTTVDTMHDEMNVCGMIAAKTSAEIATDVSKATHQLLYDGVDVAMTYRKCKNYKNSFMRKSCYARLTVKGTMYLKNARRSIKTINESTNVRIPAVFADADTCTHAASDKAILELENVHQVIDACIAVKV